MAHIWGRHKTILKTVRNKLFIFWELQTRNRMCAVLRAYNWSRGWKKSRIYLFFTNQTHTLARMHTHRLAVVSIWQGTAYSHWKEWSKLIGKCLILGIHFSHLIKQKWNSNLKVSSNVIISLCYENFSKYAWKRTKILLFF